MATRRVPASSTGGAVPLSPSSIDPTHPTPARPATNSSIAPAVPAHIIIKLATFTVLMFAAPISLYFLSLNSIFRGNSTYAGILAAVSANVVLFGYIAVAVMEDQGEQEEAKKEK